MAWPYGGPAGTSQQPQQPDRACCPAGQQHHHHQHNHHHQHYQQLHRACGSAGDRKEITNHLWSMDPPVHKVTIILIT